MLTDDEAGIGVCLILLAMEAGQILPHEAAHALGLSQKQLESARNLALVTASQVYEAFTKDAKST